MPLATKASAMSRMVRSSISVWKWFQVLKPMGGVRARPLAGSAFMDGIGSFLGARRSRSSSSSAEGFRSVVGGLVLPAKREAQVIGRERALERRLHAARHLDDQPNAVAVSLHGHRNTRERRHDELPDQPAARLANGEHPHVLGLAREDLRSHILRDPRSGELLRRSSVDERHDRRESNQCSPSHAAHNDP